MNFKKAQLVDDGYRVKWTKSLRFNLLWMLLCISIIPLIVSSIFITNISSNALINKSETELRNLSLSTTQGMDEWLTRQLEVLQLAANTDTIKSQDPARQTPLLMSIKNSSPDFATVMFVGTNGIVKAHTTKSAIGEDLGDRSYIKGPLSGVVTFSSVIVSKVTGGRIIGIGIPVKDSSGKVLGVLAATVSFDKFVQSFLPQLSTATRYPLLVDNNGMLQVAPEKAYLGKSLKEVPYPASLQEILSHPKSAAGFTTYSSSNGEHIIAFAPIKQIGYELYIDTQKTAILKDVSSINTTVISLIIVVSIIVTIIAIIALRNITRPIQKLASLIRYVANGRLDVETITVDRKNEIGLLTQDVNTMVENLKGILMKVNESAVQLAASSQQISASSEETMKSTEYIVSNVQSISSNIESEVSSISATEFAISAISQASVAISDKADSVSYAASQAAVASSKGKTAIQKTISQMNTINDTVSDLSKLIQLLGERSKQIDNIVGTITSIADQTNLLALNAAIEAARAGEQGRGFAVVASEVRKLAEQSSSSATMIGEYIKTIQVDIRNAVLRMDQGTEEVATGIDIVNLAGESFEDVRNAIEGVEKQIQHVTVATREMSTDIEKVVQAVSQLTEVSRETSIGTQSISASTEEQLATMEEMSASTKGLSEMAEELLYSIASFKI